MNIEMEVNDYLLAWYLLYGASLSKEIDRFKKNLYTKFQKEYNFCYKDRSEIIKYGKDFIPDNDILYNAVLESNLFKSLKKETMHHKMHIEKLWESNKKEINSYLKEVLRISFPKEIRLYIIHPRLEIIDFLKDFNALIWGSDKDKYDALTVMLMTITKGLLKEKHSNLKNYDEVFNSVLELAIINEIGKRISKSYNYELGDPVFKLIKRQIYPFWIMYLGYTEKETLLNKMIDDRIGFDLDKYPIDKNIKKLNLSQFIDFCAKNSRHILKLNNIMKIEQEEEIEII